MRPAATEGTLAVTLSDNGCGLTPGVPPREHNGADGLGNMQRRLHLLGGHCELTSSPGKGTTVTFRVPLQGVDRAIAG